MSSLLIMLFAAFGPMMAVFDPFGSEDEEGQDDDAFAQESPQAGFGTQGDDVFTAESDRATLYDGLSGNDTLTGGDRDDVLIGGDGADGLRGGAGNDTLFSGTQGAHATDDGNPDTLDGGAGEDELRLGGGDLGLGGEGADSFTLLADAQGGVTVGDYNSDEDALIVETTQPGGSITSQAVSNGTLRVSLSTGMTITLPGVSNPLADNAILFVPVNPLHGGS